MNGLVPSGKIANLSIWSKWEEDEYTKQSYLRKQEDKKQLVFGLLTERTKRRSCENVSTSARRAVLIMSTLLRRAGSTSYTLINTVMGRCVPKSKCTQTHKDSTRVPHDTQKILTATDLQKNFCESAILREMRSQGLSWGRANIVMKLIRATNILKKTWGTLAVPTKI